MTSKNCNKCKETKLLSEFNKAKRFNDGYRYQCKSCDKGYRIRYSKTKNGLIRKIYKSQIFSSNLRGHSSPNYSFDEFNKWIRGQFNFNMLFSKWTDSGHEKGLIPSADRIDNKKSYSIDNLQLVTWDDNRKNYYESIMNGDDTFQCKQVSKLDNNGNIVSIYHSISYASRITGVCRSSIQRCCRGLRKHAGGFEWRMS